MEKYIAAYDFGTSGVKVVLFSLNGHIRSVAEQGYALLRPKEGWAEQEPEAYWEAVCSVTKCALKRGKISAGQIAAVAFGVQAVTLIPVSAEGNPLFRAVSWLDNRAVLQAEKINGLLGEGTVKSQDHVCRMLWFKEERREIYEKAKYFLDCQSYLQYRATGQLGVPEGHPGILKQPPVIAEYYEALMEAAGIEAEKYPPAIKAMSPFAPLNERGAKDMGLEPGIPVFGGCIDVPAAAAGCGCIKEGDANVYLGSSGWLSVMVREPVKAAEGSYFLPAIDSELLIYGGCTNACCMAVNWITDLMYTEEKKTMGGKVWELINEEVSGVAPGCDGLMAAPWLHGEQFPVCDENLRGTFINAKREHGRAHFAASMMESVCFSIRWQCERYGEDYGKRLSEVRVNGGGSLSHPWMQMMADVLQMPVKIPEETRHSGAAGAALAAAVGMGACSLEET